MRVILSGGGSGEKTKELDETFASMLDKSKPLLYIPIAIDSIKHPYPACLAWLRSTFDHLGVRRYELWTEQDLHKAKKANPDTFAGVYLGGGNTPYLLKKIKESPLQKFIKRCLAKNIPIYGGSAGAAVFSQTIIPSLYHDKNWVELKDLAGFDILNGKEITCHYSKKEDKTIKKMIKEHHFVYVMALTERNGLFVNDNKTSLIGQEPAICYTKNKKKKINPGEFI